MQNTKHHALRSIFAIVTIAGKGWLEAGGGQGGDENDGDDDRRAGGLRRCEGNRGASRAGRGCSG